MGGGLALGMRWAFQAAFMFPQTVTSWQSGTSSTWYIILYVGFIVAEVFGFEDAVSVPSGFLVAGKNDGAVDLADLRDPSNVVSTDITRASNDGK